MLELAVLTDCGSFTIALRRRPGDAKRDDRALGQQRSKLLADLNELAQIFHVASGEWILDYRCRRGAPRCWFNCLVHLPAGFFNERHAFSDLRFHRNPSSPLISEAFNPPTRA